MNKTQINPPQLTKDDIGRAVLQDKKGLREFGMITGFDKLGVYVLFGMNEQPLLLRGYDLYFVEP